MSTDPLFATEGSFTADNLIAGDAMLRTEDLVITGGDYARGSVLGIITADGRARLSVTPAAAGDEGSETPAVILAKDTDASGGDVVAPCYRAGDFNERALIIDASHDLASVKDAFRGTPINILPSVSA